MKWSNSSSVELQIAEWSCQNGWLSVYLALIRCWQRWLQYLYCSTFYGHQFLLCSNVLWLGVSMLHFTSSICLLPQRENTDFTILGTATVLEKGSTVLCSVVDSAEIAASLMRLGLWCRQFFFECKVSDRTYPSFSLDACNSWECNFITVFKPADYSVRGVVVNQCTGTYLIEMRFLIMFSLDLQRPSSLSILNFFQTLGT